MILCLSNFSGKVLAQDLSIGISASFDYNAYWFANYEEKKDNIKYTGRPGYSIGATIKIDVNSSIFLKSGIFYSAKNYSEVVQDYRVIPGNPSPNYDGPYKSKFSSKFLELPIDVSFRIKSNENLNTYFLVGLINSYRVGYSSKKYFSVLNYTIEYSKYLLAVKTGIGVLANLKKNKILIEPQLRYYITQVHEEEYLSKNPFYMGIEVSYLIPMKKRK